MLNIHRRVSILLSVVAVIAFAAFVILVPATPSAGAQHGSALRARTCLEIVEAARESRAEALAHKFVYPTGGLVPGVDNGEPKILSRDPVTGSVDINEPVQTYDVLNPPPAFVPYVPEAAGATGTFQTTNLTPCWTKDEGYVVFASTMTSSVSGDPAGKSHIWVAPVVSAGVGNAGTTIGKPVQLTSGSGNDYFPVLSPSNNYIAFVSDAGTPGSHQLFVIPFNESSPAAPVKVDGLTALTVKPGGTSFSDVGRPTWSPSEDRLAFAGSVSTSAPLQYHIYYLYVATGGYLPLGSQAASNPPGQFTAGPENDIDPAWSPNGLYIAFSSNAAGFTNTGVNVNPTQGQTSCAASSTVAGSAIFLITGAGTVPASGTVNGQVSNSGNVDGGPAWGVERSTYDGFLAWHRLMPETKVADTGGTPTNVAGANHYQIVYSQIETDVNKGTLQTETVLGSTTVNTSDTYDDGTNTYSNLFDDMYPTWSPQLKQLSIGYQSNRSITYDDPKTGNPSETPINLSSTLANNPGTLSANYSGILVSEVSNINPPTLLRYSGSEVLHVNAGYGATTGNGVRYVAPGTIVTFTVRLSNRETGVDPGNVYVQIKDPDSMYDDAKRMEHKLFATDNPPAPITNQNDIYQNDTDYSIGGVYSNSQLYAGIVGSTAQTGLGPAVTNVGSNAYNNNLGAVGGVADATHDISVGTTPPGFFNNTPGWTTDTSTYQSWGTEYECQALDPLYYAQSRTSPDPRNPNPNHLDTLATDYYRPYYLAGFDDVAAHSAPQQGDPDPSNPGGNQLPQKPGDVRANLIKPVTWLKLTKLPTAPANPVAGVQYQDNNGGTLYSVSWLTPQSESDYYLDVIAYDNAQNWRIYDNVWGFTTQPWVGDKDILVVSDYTLGQKFAASTLHGAANLRPTMYGDESYYTGIDESLLPNTVYIWNQNPGVTGYAHTIFPLFNSAENTLGPGSYADRPSQQYNIWRILSRGPVDQTVLMSYAPTFQSQPAVDDNGIKESAASFPVAKKCVVWATPFTGDLLVGSGTFGSPSTQSQIAAFLNAGGRLFVSGQDVASTITLDGSINNTNPASDFLPEYLGATWQGVTSYSPLLTAANGSGDRISTDALYNESGAFHLNYSTLTANGLVYGPPASYANIVSNVENNHTTVVPPYLANFRSDGSMVDLTTDGTVAGLFLGSNDINGTMDTLAPVPSTATRKVHSDYKIGTAAGLVYYENTTNFSRVVYSSFDFGGLGLEYYKVTLTGAKIPSWPVHNLRPSVMNNIITYLRSGTVSGTITQNSGGGGGQVVAGATVYLVGNPGTPPGMPAGRTVYSATSDANGNYRIDGVESGAYVLVAYKPGYARASSTYGFAVEGDNVSNVSLNMTAVPPGSISGTVTNQSDGSPAGNATVTFTASGVPTLSATTKLDGTYSIDNVPAGTYTGQATKGTAQSTTQSVTVQSGQNLTAVNFVLPTAPAQLIGTVTDTNGPISGATITAVLTSGGTPATATTGSNGTYSLTALAPGTYSVTASATGHFPVTKQITLASGDSTTLNFTLTIGSPIILYGLVEGATAHTPIGGVSVNVEDNTNTVVASFVSNSKTSPAADPSSNSLENFQIGLPSGTYTLVPNVPGASNVTVTVGPAQYKQQNIDIPTGVIGGLVTAGPNSNAPLAGATVTVTDPTSGNVITSTQTLSTVTSPSSPAGNGKAINYTIEVAPGKYNVSVTKTGYTSPAAVPITLALGAYQEVDFSFVPLATIGAGIRMISVPYDYSSGDWDNLFGQLSGPQANRSHAYFWNQNLFSWLADPTPPADAPHLGYGYFIKLTSGVDITTAGTPPSTKTISIQLNQGWNMIGVPSTTAIAINSLTFVNPADATTPLTWADATSSFYNLVYNGIYYWQPSGQNSGSYPLPPLAGGDSLKPWNGYWIYAYQPITILLPTGS